MPSASMLSINLCRQISLVCQVRQDKVECSRNDSDRQGPQGERDTCSLARAYAPDADGSQCCPCLTARSSTRQGLSKNWPQVQVRLAAMLAGCCRMAEVEKLLWYT